MNDSYIDFARFYDGLMEDARYPERAEYFLKICRRFSHDPGRTLDLACGTGSLTRELFRRGVDVFGADYSPEMLSIAAERGYESEENIFYICQNMRSLRLPGLLDSCVCTLDSINHLINENDVRRTFKGVARHLNDGGLFVFDVNTPYKHLEVLSDNAFILENDEVFCAWQNTQGKDLLTTIDLDFFEKDGSRYVRYSESFSERAYTDSALREMLGEAGFEVLAVYGDLSFEPPGEREQRAVYVARRITEGEKTNE